MPLSLREQLRVSVPVAATERLILLFIAPPMSGCGRSVAVRDPGSSCRGKGSMKPGCRGQRSVSRHPHVGFAGRNRGAGLCHRQVWPRALALRGPGVSGTDGGGGREALSIGPLRPDLSRSAPSGGAGPRRGRGPHDRPHRRCLTGFSPRLIIRNRRNAGLHEHHLCPHGCRCRPCSGVRSRRSWRSATRHSPWANGLPILGRAHVRPCDAQRRDGRSARSANGSDRAKSDRSAKEAIGTSRSRCGFPGTMVFQSDPFSI